MKKILFIAVILLASASLFSFMNGRHGRQEEEKTQIDVETDEEAVRDLVEDFGKKLQTVSLQAPQDIVSESLKENYGVFVSPALLEKWQSEPQTAPGRMVSSPWPDRIEILDVRNLSETEYEVKGEIIEITSVEQVNGGAAAKEPITLLVKKLEDSWLIDSVTLGNYYAEPAEKDGTDNP